MHITTNLSRRHYLSPFYVAESDAPMSVPDVNTLSMDLARFAQTLAVAIRARPTTRAIYTLPSALLAVLIIACQRAWHPERDIVLPFLSVRPSVQCRYCF